MYKGKVVHRTSGAPLADVSVSDGRNVTRTDADGCFCLEGWEKTHFIYLNLLTDIDNDWYISTKNHEGDYDFSVVPAKGADDFSFLHTSDTEIDKVPFVEWLPFFRNKVAEHKPAFFVHTGDICRDFGMKRHKLVMNRETLGCPVRYVIGNHDFTGKDYAEQSYEEYFGPVWYSFDVGNTHFVATSIGKGERNPSGFAPDDQWKWLENDLESLPEGRKLIIFNHDVCPGDETAFKINIGEVDIDLHKHNIIAWVYGHMHYNLACEYNGVLNLGTACPDSGGVSSVAAGIRNVSVVGGKATTEMIYYTNEVDKVDECLWSVSLGRNSDFASPVLYNGDILAATTDDGYPKDCAIARVNGENGEIKWKYATRNSVRNDMAVSDGTVYAQDTEGNMYALDVECGKLLWQARSTLNRPMYTKMNVLVIDDLVIGGAPYWLSAYNKKTGELAWEFKTEKGCEPTPAKLIFDAERRQLIINRHWRDLMIVDYDTKEIKLEYSEDMVRFRNETPLVVGDKLYGAGLWKLHTFDLNSGELLVCADAPACMDVCGSPAYDGDVLYYPTSTIGVIAVDRDTLKLVRKYPCGIAGVITPPYRYGAIQTVESTPIVDGDMLIFSSSDGCVYFYDKTTAELKRRICFGAPVLTTPIFDDGAVIALDFCGNLTKIKL